MLVHASKSQRGGGRDKDVVLEDEGLGLFAVAHDRYGGCHETIGVQAGWDALCKSLRGSAEEPSVALRLALAEADRVLAAPHQGRGHPMSYPMASFTVLFMGEEATIGQVGTGRCYLVRGGKATLPLSDHTHEVRPALGIPVRILGMPEEEGQRSLPPDILSLQLQADDTFVLCSVGLWTVLDVASWTERYITAPPVALCSLLIGASQAASRAVSLDRSVQIVRVVSASLR